MKVSTNKFVSASYDLYVGGEDGNEPELMEKATAEKPLSFIFGTGMMLEAFENNMAGLSEGASFDFTLASEDAYGEYSDEKVVDIPRSVFEVDGKIDEDVIFENNIVPMMDQDGNRLDGAVVSIGEEHVKMDFNHPLAGEDLHFIGQVLVIREPSEEEVKQLMGGGCGCGCGEEGCDGCGEQEDEANCGCGSCH
ncbi:MAG: FKBP-type peptidyl-prolyl cis-trans isomerase [Bacteroidales bacterium]|nr:FKBP-type peptidyl-prolyl cis-trans isomerase [Bacteroidales bacterium]